MNYYEPPSYINDYENAAASPPEPAAASPPTPPRETPTKQQPDDHSQTTRPTTTARRPETNTETVNNLATEEGINAPIIAVYPSRESQPNDYLFNINRLVDLHADGTIITNDYTLYTPADKEKLNTSIRKMEHEGHTGYTYAIQKAAIHAINDYENNTITELEKKELHHQPQTTLTTNDNNQQPQKKETEEENAIM